jgi:hypothetical protein
MDDPKPDDNSEEFDNMVKEIMNDDAPKIQPCLVCLQEPRRFDGSDMISFCREHPNKARAHLSCVSSAVMGKREDLKRLICFNCDAYFIPYPHIESEVHTTSRAIIIHLINWVYNLTLRPKKRIVSVEMNSAFQETDEESKQLNNAAQSSEYNAAADLHREKQMANASISVFFMVIAACLMAMFAMALSEGLDWRVEIVFFTIFGPLLIFGLLLAPEKASYFLNMCSNVKEAKIMIDVFLIARICVIVLYLATYMLMMSLTTNEVSYAWNLTVTMSFIFISIYLLIVSHRKIKRAIATTSFRFSKVSTK